MPSRAIADDDDGFEEFLAEYEPEPRPEPEPEPYARDESAEIAELRDQLEAAEERTAWLEENWIERSPAPAPQAPPVDRQAQRAKLPAEVEQIRARAREDGLEPWGRTVSAEPSPAAPRKARSRPRSAESAIRETAAARLRSGEIDLGL